MEILQLRYFLAVVEHGGVNRAASALHVAQPSLSQAIRRLEKDLQTELFHRVGRGLVLAPAGEALIGPARQMLRHLSAAYDAVHEVRDMGSGRVDIASLADLSTEPVSRWVAHFRVKNPRLSVRVEDRGTVSGIAELVRSGQCEIGFGVLPTPHVGLVSEHLVTQHFALIAPPTTDDDFDEIVPLAALDGVPFVTGEQNTTTRVWIASELAACGAEPWISVEASQRGAVQPLVLNGAGMAIVPLRIALEAHEQGAVIRQVDPPLRRDIGVFHRPGALTPASSAFLDNACANVTLWERDVTRHMGEGRTRIEAAALARAAVRERHLRDLHEGTRAARRSRNASQDS
ncbi:LysR family transcriptional regulator [Dietzia natronolimnaea]|nr:LysR family transcriptional regulator [Dietzia natronolimnaea]MBB1037667.1 LysR family transcriptional regulator [Dietzia natronolimnaea]